MMTPSHSKTFVIPRTELRQVAEARLREADHLLDQGCFAGAMFLGGCALECFLKLAICTTLRLDGLPWVFKIHDLDVLILYTGFEAELREDASLRGAFDRVVDEWGSDGRATLLYGDPGEFDRQRAAQFLASLRDPQHGVITWLRSRLS
jgi:hypothetical protein